MVTANKSEMLAAVNALSQNDRAVVKLAHWSGVVLQGGRKGWRCLKGCAKLFRRVRRVGNHVGGALGLTQGLNYNRYICISLCIYLFVYHYK